MLVGNTSNLSLDKDEQGDLIDKFLHFEFNQTILPSISLQIVCPCNLLQKASTPSSSPSWIYLVNLGFQQPSSPSCFHASATHAWRWLLRITQGKPLLRVCYHTICPSIQNFTFFSFPTLKIILLLKSSSTSDTLPHAHFIPFPHSFRAPSLLFLKWKWLYTQHRKHSVSWV